MKAVVITAPGPVENLAIRDVPDPTPPQGDNVCVRVRAAGLNRADILQRLGRYPAPPGFPPSIPGLEFAGEVASVGSDVHRWRSGQRVFGIVGGGAHAEYIVVREDQLAEIPANLDWAEAASVPEVFITAHDALFLQAGLKSGESVLVHAVGSGVGTAAIQLAKANGADAYGTSRTQEKLDLARQYGLKDGIAVADDSEVFAVAVNNWTDGRGVDVILDLVGAAYFAANLKALAKQGRMMLVGTPAGSQASLDIATVMCKRLRIIGTVLRSRSAAEKAAVIQRFAAEVVPLLTNGTVKPVLDRIYSVSDVREAHLRMESNRSFGKIVLVFS